MKLNLKLSLALLIGAAVAFTACHKSDHKPANTVSSQVVSGKVATQLQKLFSGELGVSFNKSSSSTAGTHAFSHRLRLNDVSDICGFSQDTTFNDSFSDDTTQFTLGGRSKFAYSCTNGTPTGMTMSDSLRMTMESTHLSIGYSLLDNLNMTSSSFLDEAANTTINGFFSLSMNITYKPNTKTNEKDAFTFKNVVTNSGGEVISGSMTFSSTGSDATGSWDVAGEITFLGGGEAEVNIGGNKTTIHI